MHRFYAPDIETSLCLPEEEAKHCFRVLRLKEGDEIEVVDGWGGLYHCRSIDSRKSRVNIENKSKQLPHWGCNITIAITPTKNIDRLEWMVEKVVEMGVNRIVPLLCAHSERKVMKTERLNKIVVSAMKQSLKTVAPQLDELTPIRSVISVPFSGQKFIAYCGSEFPRRDFVKEYKKGEDVIVLIGPEGDFSPEEVSEAVGAGFVPVSLGESRLRTETAGMFACAAVHTINQM